METLQPLNETQLINDQSTNNKKLTEEIKEINCNFEKTEPEISVVKKLNDALVKQVSSVDWQCWKNTQYSRRECTVAVGISSPVEHDQLESTFCVILQEIGVNITGNKKETCHCLGKNSDRTILNLSAEKIVSTQCVAKRIEKSRCYWPGPFSRDKAPH